MQGEGQTKRGDGDSPPKGWAESDPRYVAVPDIADSKSKNGMDMLYPRAVWWQSATGERGKNGCFLFVCYRPGDRQYVKFGSEGI